MLIIKDKIDKFMVGYPTVSDKYNVLPGTLAGDNPAKFGDIVVYSDTKGYYEKPTTITASSKIAGIVLATNVKLDLQWPQGKVETLPGEAFNLLLDGFVAVQCDDTITDENTIKTNDPVYVTANGGYTNVASGNFAVPNAVFTGETETRNGEVFAEVFVK